MCAIEFDTRHAKIYLFEAAALQALAQDPEAVAIPHQNLDPIASTVEKAEEVPCEGILPEAIPYDSDQPVDAHASVDW